MKVQNNLIPLHIPPQSLSALFLPLIGDIDDDRPTEIPTRTIYFWRSIHENVTKGLIEATNMEPNDGYEQRYSHQSSCNISMWHIINRNLLALYFLFLPQLPG